jgi:hypothetical protein
MKEVDHKNLRKRIAREAALLLYTSQEKEYKQAKRKAAKILGVRVLPSNLEIALELDKIAQEREGKERVQRLIQMREQALRIMETLARFHPKLVGSVWRGTIRYNSDIDISVSSDNPREVLEILRGNGFKIERTEWQTVTKNGETKYSFHVYVDLPIGNKAEVVIVPSQERNSVWKCEIYGDKVTGLTINQLKQVLKENPTKKFLPFKCQ